MARPSVQPQFWLLKFLIWLVSGYRGYRLSAALMLRLRPWKMNKTTNLVEKKYYSGWSSSCRRRGNVELKPISPPMGNGVGARLGAELSNKIISGLSIIGKQVTHSV